MSSRMTAVVATWLVLAGFTASAAQSDPVPARPAQDPQVLRWTERAVAWCPGSSFEITEDERQVTPSGSYRRLVVERSCDNTFLAGGITLLIDEVTSTVWLGSVARLPIKEAGVNPAGLRGFIESFLPGALESRMRMKVRVSWDAGSAPAGALIPFTLLVDTGYGEYRKPVAVTSDGDLLVIGGAIPLAADPVAFRAKLLHDSGVVMWDHGSRDAKLEIVEFSDLECPACKGKWPLVTAQMERFQGDLRHGMVSYPLTGIHPWSFRAAAATWCVADQAAEQLVPFKELFYSLQRDMEVSLVTTTALDFVAGNGLDEEAFRACYLRSPSLTSVHAQIALAQDLGIMSTPTYVVNGWMVQAPTEDWFPGFLDQLAKDREP